MRILEPSRSSSSSASPTGRAHAVRLRSNRRCSTLLSVVACCRSMSSTAATCSAIAAARPSSLAAARRAIISANDNTPTQIAGIKMTSTDLAYGIGAPRALHSQVCLFRAAAFTGPQPLCPHSGLPQRRSARDPRARPEPGWRAPFRTAPRAVPWARSASASPSPIRVPA